MTVTGPNDSHHRSSKRSAAGARFCSVFLADTGLACKAYAPLFVLLGDINPLKIRVLGGQTAQFVNTKARKNPRAQDLDS